MFPCFALLGNESFDPDILYLTWQHNPTSSMTIQWLSDLTTTGEENDQIEYRPEGSNEWQKISGSHQRLPDNVPYLLHRVELTQLTSDSSYQFKLQKEGKVYKFKTMPTLLNKPITFVVGGDVYHDAIQNVIVMNRQAASRSPAFVLIGGDIAYSAGRHDLDQLSNDKIENSQRWLEWLRAWKQEMITPEGFLIPIVPTIGNHEVLGGYYQFPSQARFYYTFFASPERQGFYSLDFGNYLSIIALDSDHTTPVGGSQSEWLAHTLAARQQLPHKFAFYHVGAYPSFRSFLEPVSQAIRRHWIPIFEKYSLNAAFEHHDHAYKRTYPIKNNQIDPSGVLYIGDGAWGIGEPRIPRKPGERWYLAKTLSARHIIEVTIELSSRRYRAFTENGLLIDSFHQMVH